MHNQIIAYAIFLLSLLPRFNCVQYPWDTNPVCKPPRPPIGGMFGRYSRTEPLMHEWNCTSGVVSRSQMLEDVRIYRRYFAGKRNGFFLEMGALDGLQFSNTLIYEQCFGWNGILIEAEPTNAAALKKNRPCAITVHAAGGNGGGTLHMTQSRGVSRVVEGPGENTVEVPVRRMADIFAEWGITKIDFFSLDVEGSEFMVLESIDFDAVDISLLLVEKSSTFTVNPTTEKVRALLLSKGYHLMPAVAPRCNRRTHHKLEIDTSDVFVKEELRDDICRD